MEKKIITPKTKIAELLESYPKLEQKIIDYAPAFKKLKNPVLRKTIAKITTLQQAAAIANISVENLINRLRKEVGQDLISGQDDAKYNEKKPGWFNEKNVSEKFDAGEMLNAGEHPVNQVMADLNSMKSKEIYELRAPFLPAPLIDKASSIGFEHWVANKESGKYLIYFYKN